MKHCNDYRIIVSCFVLVAPDSRFKIPNRLDKRMLWSLMIVSLWFSISSPFSFFPCERLFCLFCLCISVCVDLYVWSWGKLCFWSRHLPSGLLMSFVHSWHPEKYLFLQYWSHAKYSCFSFPFTEGQKSGWSHQWGDYLINIFFLSSSVFSLLYYSFHQHILLCPVSSNMCCSGNTNWPFLNIPFSSPNYFDKMIAFHSQIT